MFLVQQERYDQHHRHLLNQNRLLVKQAVGSTLLKMSKWANQTSHNVQSCLSPLLPAITAVGQNVWVIADQVVIEMTVGQVVTAKIVALVGIEMTVGQESIGKIEAWEDIEMIAGREDIAKEVIAGREVTVMIEAREDIEMTAAIAGREDIGRIEAPVVIGLAVDQV